VTRDGARDWRNGMRRALANRRISDTMAYLTAGAVRLAQGAAL